jgi:hypothetical protein
MAYFSKEMKAAIAPKISALLKEYGVKGSLAIENYSAVVLNLRSGAIDFGREYDQVNVYHVDSFYSGKAKEFLLKAVEILNTGNYDNSDAQSDYFDRGFYISINVGRWDKAYVVSA